MGSPDSGRPPAAPGDVLARAVARMTGWTSLDAAGVSAALADLVLSELGTELVCVEVPTEPGAELRIVRPSAHAGVDGMLVDAMLSRVSTAPPLDPRTDAEGRRVVRLALPELSGQVTVAARRADFPDARERTTLSLVVAHAALAIRLDRERAARRALEDAAERKDELLAVLAHEVRNPLAAVVTASELLEDTVTGQEEIARAVMVVGRQSRQAARLLDGLLEVARVGRSDITLDAVPIDLAELTRRTVEAHQDRAGQLGIELAPSLPSEPVVVRGDAVRLTQVISNLITNALKFTPRGGRVGIALEASPYQVNLAVRDTGVGMEPHELETVFELFERGSGDAGPDVDGLGIGLSIVRDILRLHGGDVSARSAGRDRGTEMVACLPRVHDEARRLTSRSMPVISRRGLRLLIVDDNEDAAEMLALLVGRLGHVARIAHDGHAALAEIESFAPDVALVDLGLPDMDGFELGGRLLERAPNLGLMAVTGYGRDDDRARTLAAGFFRHLVKPARVVDLEAALGEWSQLAAAPTSTDAPSETR